MARFSVEDIKSLHTWRAFPTGDVGDGGEVSLHIRRLSRTEKADFLSAQAVGDYGRATEILLSRSIDDWDGVEDAHGRQIAFAFSSLDAILGLDDELAREVSDYLMELNGLAPPKGGDGKGSKPAPLTTTRSSDSTSSSTPVTSPEPPGSPGPSA